MFSDSLIRVADKDCHASDDKQSADHDHNYRHVSDDKDESDYNGDNGSAKESSRDFPTAPNADLGAAEVAHGSPILTK